ncbi:hypothetical protein HNY73_021726 [Argiope bruennichi]|uniref:Uncharacterized protein n=1 Tax=Argiope bruennichi TaxID=94029 RepID=A0A8T0DZZ8_ARGBR|nr:hypothetical protein HNY73_021726 [Argiope bruennichi]
MSAAAFWIRGAWAAFTALLLQPSRVISGFIGFGNSRNFGGLVLFSLFFFLSLSPLMAKEEDRKAIGGELESEMVILSPATNGRCFSPITDLAACLGLGLLRATVVFDWEAHCNFRWVSLLCYCGEKTTTGNVGDHHSK